MIACHDNKVMACGDTATGKGFKETGDDTNQVGSSTLTR